MSECICGKEYKRSDSLRAHKENCSENINFERRGLMIKGKKLHISGGGKIVLWLRQVGNRSKTAEDRRMRYHFEKYEKEAGVILKYNLDKDYLWQKKDRG